MAVKLDSSETNNLLYSLDGFGNAVIYLESHLFIYVFFIYLEHLIY